MNAAALSLSRRLLAPFLALLVALWAGLATAQDTAPDYEAWERLATRAESVIDAGRASDAALAELRGQLADFRQQFANARETNAARIQTLQSQLDALGPPPEEGAEETADIAQRRKELNDRLAMLREPALRADAAHNRADGLVGEIDSIIRKRQAERLLTRGPSPLNPAHWPGALKDIDETWQDLVNEVRTGLSNPTQRRTFQDNILPVVVLSLAGIFLVLRGGRLARSAGLYLSGFGGRGMGVWPPVVSFGRVLLPLLGIYLVTRAMQMTGLVGLRVAPILDALPLWTTVLFGFAWLAERLFAPRQGYELIPYPPERLGWARWYYNALGAVLVLHLIAELVSTTENLPPETVAVLHFPLILVGGLFLFQLTRLLRSAAVAYHAGPEDEKHSHPGLQRVLPPLRGVAMLIGLAAPLVAAAGYLNAAVDTLFPMIGTLGAVSLLLVLSDFVIRIYGWISGRGEEAQETLVAGLISVLLTVVALPLISLIWGVRVSDLLELWQRFLEGVSIGGTRISPVEFLTFAVIFALGYMVTRVLQGALQNSILPKTQIDPGGQTAIVSGMGYVGLFLSAVIAISGAGIDLSSLAIVAGALSVGIGFGLQTIVSNFVSGVILLIERPISEGDWIEVGPHMGYVREISVRSTRIETFDRSEVIVPNSDFISGSVTNYTRRNNIGRVIVPVGVAYGTDTRKVEQILREVAEAHPMVLANPAPSILFQGFGADSLDFEIRAILRDVNWMLSVKSDMNHEIAKRFAEEGIEIPFAQRDIWLRNPEALVVGTAIAGSDANGEEGDAPDAPANGGREDSA